jgi:type I restriction enzyme S subunit
MDLVKKESISLPNSWKMKKLSELCFIETGKRTKGGAKSKGIPSIGGAQINNSGNIKWDNMVYIPESFYIKLKQGKLQKNDVLIVKDGATTGKTAIIREMKEKEAAINEHVFLLKPKDNNILDNYFLFAQLYSNLGQKQVKKAFHGACQGGINKTNISNFILLQPNISEQKKISYVLLAIQELKEKTQNVINSLEDFKKSVMKHLFTFGYVRLK